MTSTSSTVMLSGTSQCSPMTTVPARALPLGSSADSTFTSERRTSLRDTSTVSMVTRMPRAADPVTIHARVSAGANM